jgi:hypothetical protein
VSWRFVALWKNLFSLFFSLARDALAVLLREHGMDDQVERLMQGELAKLHLNGRSIGDDHGAEIVADFLKHDNTVERVYLGYCKIGPRGVKAIAESLKHNQTVEEMYLFLNPIGGKGAEALIEALNLNVCMEFLTATDESVGPKLQATMKYLTETRNQILIPAAVRRASLSLIAARRSIADAGNLAMFPKEIVKMIAIEVWATRKEPIWINALTESERTGELCD